jgi:dipeptidase
MGDRSRKGGSIVRKLLWLAVVWSILGEVRVAPGCTNILVTKGASSDGSVIVSYSVDGEFHPTLRFTPAADHQPGEMTEIKDWDGKVRLRIPQPAHTYAVTGIMNEHQLVIGETTFDGRPELENPEGGLPYWTLMRLTLQRARTAREAIKVMTSLVEEFGYASTGESFSIGDPNEAWILEMVGPGKGGHGAEWVALRVPDGMIAAHANRSRISTFPLNDPDHCVHSANVVDFAVQKGYYDPKRDKVFSFCEVYCPATAQDLRYTETRVWSIFRRAAPSLGLSVDYSRGTPGARPYPLWIKPDRTLSVADVMALMRDHYEGTPLDMTQGLDAGAFGSPLRNRPMTFTKDGKTYSWERPISTQQTGCTYVGNARSFLPDAVGGVLWYGLDDTYTSCFFPLYAGNTAVPEPYTKGSLGAFSWDDPWWVTNLVANYAQLKFSAMVKDIQKVQQELEGNFLALQPAIEKTAQAMLAADPERARRFLTDYSVSSGEQVARRWRELAGALFTKYNDGYVQDAKGEPKELGYPESWLREVVKARGKDLELPSKDVIKSPESY